MINSIVNLELNISSHENWEHNRSRKKGGDRELGTLKSFVFQCPLRCSYFPAMFKVLGFFWKGTKNKAGREKYAALRNE